ncbi:hypothetical protein SDC9_145232 [bioreactor metagenome]|uniref:RloB domain-containing protein n=1 Tax=bioreactor metagenome TaxID=1076179 RepID=A0A645E9E3_9ZZZZ
MNIDIVGTAKETLRVVKKAIDIRSQKTIEPFYDSVWTVFDKDSFSERDFNSAIKKANDHNIKCAWSNEAFELWYILHFEYMHTGLMRKDYKKKLEVHIKKKEGKYFKYKKNIENMYELLAKYGSQKQAINWAKKLEENHIVRGREYAKQNPCTRVYALVEELNNPETILKST